ALRRTRALAVSRQRHRPIRTSELTAGRTPAPLSPAHPSFRLPSRAALRLVSSRLAPKTQPRPRPAEAKPAADSGRAGQVAAEPRGFRAGPIRREKSLADTRMSALQETDDAGRLLARRSDSAHHCARSSMTSLLPPFKLRKRGS